MKISILYRCVLWMDSCSLHDTFIKIWYAWVREIGNKNLKLILRACLHSFLFSLELVVKIVKRYFLISTLASVTMV